MIYSYDTKIFNFRNRILDEINKSKLLLKQKNNLYYLHKNKNEDIINNVYSVLYNLFKTNDFQIIYDKFCKLLIKRHFNKNTKFQRIPSVRIQTPGSKSVNFHNDNFYGHGTDVKNIWLPITNPKLTNSLFVCTNDSSQKIIKEIKKNNLNINQINNLSLKFAKPLNIKVGEYFLFDSKIIHGTLKNLEKETRVSIDFRFVENNNTGLKSSYFFKKYGESKNVKVINCVSYFNKKKLKDSLPSQKYQQLICVEYCKDNQLKNLKLETELTGFKHYPVLKDLIKNSKKEKYKNIILFSKKNLPRDQKNLFEIYNIAKKYKVTMHFISENETLSF